METILLKGKPMYSDVKVAENGFMVCWSEKMPGKTKMDHCDYRERSHIFTSDQEDDAFDFFVKLKKQEMGMLNTDSEDSRESEGY